VEILAEIQKEDHRMRNQISIAAAGLGVLGAMLAVQAQAANLAHNAPNETSSEPFFFYCLSGSEMQNTFYLSPTKRSDAGVSRQNLENSFRASLAQKYKYPNTGLISCPFLASGSTQARTEADRQRIINNLHTGHYDFVETDWTYSASAATPSATSITPSAAATGNPARGAVTPAPSAASPGPVGPKQDVSRARVASAAPSRNPAGSSAQGTGAPQTLYAVCWGETPTLPEGRSAFFGVPFEVTSRTPNQAWAKAYRQVLAAKYGRIGAINCRVLNSLPEAQKWSQQLMNGHRSTFKIVETGWKYE
jgi:hypothetical protein